jgi:hypothetical protein
MTHNPMNSWLRLSIAGWRDGSNRNLQIYNKAIRTGPLPAILARIERLTAGVAVDLDAPIEGDVAL